MHRMTLQPTEPPTQGSWLAGEFSGEQTAGKKTEELGKIIGAGRWEARKWKQGSDR